MRDREPRYLDLLIAIAAAKPLFYSYIFHLYTTIIISRDAVASRRRALKIKIIFYRVSYSRTRHGGIHMLGNVIQLK